MTEELDGTLIVPRFAPRIHPTPIPALGVFDEPQVCVSVNRFWVSHVLGVLEALDQPDTWIGTALEIESARQNVRELILALAEGNCVPNTFDVRQNEAEPCILEKTVDGLIWVPFAALDLCAQPAPATPPPHTVFDDLREHPTTGQPQASFDGGVTWTDIFPQSGETPEPYAPPLQPTTATNDIERTCLASTRAALVLNEFYKQTFGAFTAGITNALGSINQFLYNVNKTLFSIVYGDYYNVLNAIDFFDQEFTTNYTAPALTQAALDDLTCLLDDYASADENGVVTFDFQAVHDNLIATLGLNPGTALTYLVANIGSSGLNQAGTVQNTETLNDCCAPEVFDWGHQWDMTVTNASTQPSILSGAGCGNATALATWVSGQGYQDKVCNYEPSYAQTGALVNFSGVFMGGKRTFRRIEADVFLNATVGTPEYDEPYIYVGTYDVGATFGDDRSTYAPAGSSGEVTVGYTLSQDRSDHGVRAHIGVMVGNMGNYIRRIRVFGNGVKPSFAAGTDLPQ